MPDPGSDAIDVLVTSRSRRYDAHIRNLAEVLRRWEKTVRQFPDMAEDLYLHEWRVMVKTPDLIVVSPPGGTPEKYFIVADQGGGEGWMIGEGRADDPWSWATGPYGGPIKGSVSGPLTGQKRRRLARFRNPASALHAILSIASDFGFAGVLTWAVHPVTGRFVRRR
jgi:hypothetical protein